jgi:MFS family permease
MSEPAPAALSRKELYTLVASAVAGLSQTMLQLIVFRGLQGLGGGGLISLAFTVVSDVVSPRERGKYQGFFGAVFGIASVAGPANLPAAVAKLSPAEAADFSDTDLSAVMESPTVVAHLPEPVRSVVQQAFTDGLDRVFLVAALIAAVTIVLTLFMPNLALRGSAPARTGDDPDAAAAEIRADTAP